MNIPKRTAERLIKIYRYLFRCEKGNVTSAELEKALGASQDVIRRDFSLLKISVGKSNGYEVSALKDKISEILDMKGKSEGSEKRCCIVGLGKLGETFLYTDVFKKSGFKIVAGFDSNVNRTEILKSTFPLHPLSRLKIVAKEEKIDFAILAVDDEDAQKAAEVIGESGIKGIVNYSAVLLSVNIPVVDVDPVSALRKLNVECDS